MGAPASHAACSSTSAAAVLTQQNVGCSPLSAWLETYAGAASNPACSAQPASHGTCIRRILQLLRAANCDATHVISTEPHVAVQLSPSWPITGSTPSSRGGSGGSGMTGFPALAHCHHQRQCMRTSTRCIREHHHVTIPRQPRCICTTSNSLSVLLRTQRRKAVLVRCQVGILVDRAVGARPALASAVLKGRAPLSCLRSARTPQSR